MYISGALVAGVVALGSGLLASAYPDLSKRQSRTVPLLGSFPGQGLLPTLADILSLNTSGTFLSFDDIQADVLVGMKKQKETFLFFHINDAAAFRTALGTYLPQITSTATILSAPALQPLAFVNIAFSQSGLTTLGITDNLGDSLFSAGQFADAPSLSDDLSTWEAPFKGTNIHGVFLIGSDQTTYTNTYASNIVSQFGSSITQVYRIDAASRPPPFAGHEHFGFLDGISNPAVTGFSPTVLPGQTLVLPGIILTGRLGDTGLRPLWTRDGTFMAFRKLQQKVPEFNKWLLDNALPHAPGGPALTVQQGADLLGARMVGRWKSGAPTDLAPTADDPALGADPQRNNDFDFSHPLPSLIISDQAECPFSAHIRKTNPRADLLNTNTINHAIRAGTPYGPEVSAAESAANTSTQDRGLAFVEYQSSIANGFRFQQVNWANTANFPPLKTVTPGIEPIIGQGGGKVAQGLDPNNPSVSTTVPLFVVPKGGEYFFVPSISALQSKFV